MGVGVTTGIQVISRVFCPGNTSAVTPPLQQGSPFSSNPSISKFRFDPVGTSTVIFSSMSKVFIIGSKPSVTVSVKNATQSRMLCWVDTSGWNDASRHCSVGNPIVNCVPAPSEPPSTPESRHEIWIRRKAAKIRQFLMKSFVLINSFPRYGGVTITSTGALPDGVVPGRRLAG